MRAPRLRRAPGGAAPHGGGGGLSSVAVFSAHLTGTAVGALRIWASEAGVRRIDFGSGPDLARPGEAHATGAPPAHLAAAVEALGGYLTGRLRAFDLPLDLRGVSDFQLRVYERLRGIPWGQVVTYGQVAQDIGADHAAAARAVGGAVGANPLPIVIPCHRVIASDGRLTGFGGGLPRKAALLAIEGIQVDGVQPSSRVHPEVLTLPL